MTSGTTNEAAMKQLNDKYKLGITIVSARDHDESYAMLADGKADAFATDDVLLYGFIAAGRPQATMAVVGDFITYEPYGLMFRRDDPLMATAVTRAFQPWRSGARSPTPTAAGSCSRRRPASSSICP